MAWSDWVRWGPIWAGLLTIVATLAVLGSLGAALALSIWGPNPNTAFNYGWSIFTGVVAYFLGGWVTARTAGVTGVSPAVLNAAMAWALSLAAMFLLAFVSAGRVDMLTGGLTPALTTAQTATASWVTFATLVIGLILAMIGGAVGSHRLEWRR
jgi:hypothetical protein